MLFFSNSKINLGLKITSKRDDGYHNIESIFYPIPFGDCIEFVETEGHGEIKIELGGIKIPGDPKQNLIVKAYEILNRDFALPSINVFLLKNVPTGSGIGGGSSDGAWMLKVLNEYFNLNVSTQKLKEYALDLGSDCPFFIESKPSFVSGRGEKLQALQLDLTDKHLILLRPDLHISTAESYANLSPIQTLIYIDLKILPQLKLEEWSAFLKNDFEPYAFEKYPILGLLKQSLYELGAFYSSMSGTGSTIYGIFENEVQIPNELKEYVIWSGKL